MVDEARKKEWIKKTIENQPMGIFLEKNRCDRCGGVGFGITSVVDLSFLCLDCLGNVLFEKPIEKPKLDLEDFAKI